MAPNFLQGWHNHYTPKVASVLLIRSQIILLTLAVPRFCYQSIVSLTSLFCCSYLKATYFGFIFLNAVKAEFLCFKHVARLFLSAQQEEDHLNHFSINILLGKCRETVYCGEVTAQAKGGFGFTACR